MQNRIAMAVDNTAEGLEFAQCGTSRVARRWMSRHTFGLRFWLNLQATMLFAISVFALSAFANGAQSIRQIGSEKTTTTVKVANGMSDGRISMLCLRKPASKNPFQLEPCDIVVITTDAAGNRLNEKSLPKAYHPGNSTRSCATITKQNGFLFLTAMEGDHPSFYARLLDSIGGIVAQKDVATPWEDIVSVCAFEQANGSFLVAVAHSVGKQYGVSLIKLSSTLESIWQSTKPIYTRGQTVDVRTIKEIGDARLVIAGNVWGDVGKLPQSTNYEKEVKKQKPRHPSQAYLLQTDSLGGNLHEVRTGKEWVNNFGGCAVDDRGLISLATHSLKPDGIETYQGTEGLAAEWRYRHVTYITQFDSNLSVLREDEVGTFAASPLPSVSGPFVCADHSGSVLLGYVSDSLGKLVLVKLDSLSKPIWRTENRNVGKMDEVRAIFTSSNGNISVIGQGAVLYGDAPDSSCYSKIVMVTIDSLGNIATPGYAAGSSRPGSDESAENKGLAGKCLSLEKQLKGKPGDVNIRWQIGELREFTGDYAGAAKQYQWIVDSGQTFGCTEDRISEARAHLITCRFLAKRSGGAKLATKSKTSPSGITAGSGKIKSPVPDTTAMKAQWGFLRDLAASVAVAGGLTAADGSDGQIQSALQLLDQWNASPLSGKVEARNRFLTGMVSTLVSIIAEKKLGIKVNFLLAQKGYQPIQQWPEANYAGDMQEEFKALPPPTEKRYEISKDLVIVERAAQDDISGEYECVSASAGGYAAPCFVGTQTDPATGLTTTISPLTVKVERKRIWLHSTGSSTSPDFTTSEYGLTGTGSGQTYNYESSCSGVLEGSQAQLQCDTRTSWTTLTATTSSGGKTYSGGMPAGSRTDRTISTLYILADGTLKLVATHGAYESTSEYRKRK